MAHLWPNGNTVLPRVTSEWSQSRRNPVTNVIQPHNGIDIVGFSGVLASAAGVVTSAGYAGAGGNRVRLHHDDGTETTHLHLKSISVSLGQRVGRGQQLGIMGTTGSSTGVHLHWETRNAPGASSFNPRDFMAARGERGGTAGGGTTPIPSTPSTPPLPISKDDDMRLFRETNGTVFFATSGGVTSVDNPEHLGVLQRFLGTAANAFDTFNAPQRDWIISYISRAQNDAARYNAVLSAIASEGAKGREHGQAVENNATNALSALIAKQAAPEPYKFTDAEIAKIGSQVKAFDPTEVIAAIKASSTQVLAAIAQVDESTLATFGLKRA